MSCAVTALSASAGQASDLVLANVIHAHSSALLARAQRLTGRSADAWDLVQDTLLRAVLHMPSDLPADKLRNWLFVVMNNLHIDGRRRAGRRRLVPLEESSLVTDTPVAQTEEEVPLWHSLDYDQVRQCLPWLAAQFREAFVLHEEQGLSLADTARRLRVPLSTAGTRVFRARRQLRALLLAQRADDRSETDQRTTHRARRDVAPACDEAV